MAAQQHEYRVVVCDRFGTASGEILNARPTSITWDLNGIGSATFTFPILDSGPSSGRTLLPPSAFPAAVEVQILRDGQIIWWGVPVSAAANRSVVTVQCSGLLWYLQNSNFGPIAAGIASDQLTQYLVNRQFEQGLTGWTVNGVTTTIDHANTPGQIVLLDQQAVRLNQAFPNVDTYLGQTVTVDTADGFVMALTGWFYIDPVSPTPLGPAVENRGLYMEVRNGGGTLENVQFAPISANAPIGVWTRLETFVGIPAGSFGWTVGVRLYAPEGQIIWDDISLVAPQSVGSSSNGSDVATIVQNILDYANSPAAGKWRMNIPYDTSSPATGQILIREYQFSDNAVILDALNEFPNMGVADFEVIWASQPASVAPARKLHLYSPVKGSYKQENPLVLGASSFTDLSLNVDGSKVRTAQRVLGQGSSGTAREVAYLAFPSYLGGKVTTATVAVDGPRSIITTSAPFFVSSDLGDAVYGLTPAGFSDGVWPPGTIIANVVDSMNAEVSQAANHYGSGFTVGVGGALLDDVTTAQVSQPAGAVAATPLRRLGTFSKPLIIPDPKVDANGVIGVVAVGDVVPVSIDYGWAQLSNTPMRVASMTLFPPTEEVSLKLNPVTLQ